VGVHKRVGNRPLLFHGKQREGHFATETVKPGHGVLHIGMEDDVFRRRLRQIGKALAPVAFEATH
jgi:hypothetical protein